MGQAATATPHHILLYEATAATIREMIRHENILISNRFSVLNTAQTITLSAFALTYVDHKDIAVYFPIIAGLMIFLTYPSILCAYAAINKLNRKWECYTNCIYDQLSKISEFEAQIITTDFLGVIGLSHAERSLLAFPIFCRLKCFGIKNNSITKNSSIKTTLNCQNCKIWIWSLFRNRENFIPLLYLAAWGLILYKTQYYTYYFWW